MATFNLRFTDNDRYRPWVLRRALVAQILAVTAELEKAGWLDESEEKNQLLEGHSEEIHELNLLLAELDSFYSDRPLS